MMFLSILAVGMMSRQTAPNLRGLVSNRFSIGSCVDVQLLKANADAGQYAEVLSRNYNLVEPENDLKPPAIWQGIGKYNFSNPDYLLGAPGEVGWAAKNRIKVRGHVLVYARDDGYTIPGWLLKMEAQISPDQAKTLLKDYISTVAGRYKGKISMWDVANEAIDERPNQRPFNLRDSFWFRKLGPEFLVLAFQYAHTADPRAELYYNEFGVENGGPKADHMMELAKYIRDHGGPITGIGLQYHTGLYEHVAIGDGHYQLLDRISAAKLNFMITELDLGIDVQRFPQGDPKFGVTPTDPGQVTAQASHYADIFKMATSYRNCHGIQMWGFTDKYSWISRFSRGKGAALIFDAEYQPKPALLSIEEVLKLAKR